MWQRGGRMQLHCKLAFFACLLAVLNAQEYEVPDAILMAYKPRGLHVSIPDEEGIELFAFHANINKPIKNREAGYISVDVLEPERGRWVYENDRVRLKSGDVINFWLYVQVDGRGYPKDGLTWTVTELVDKSAVSIHPPTQRPPTTPSGCNSVTTVNGKQACQGQLIFEETFDSLQSSKWKPAIQIGGDPAFPFVIYTDNNRNSYTANGNLVIKPTIMPDDQVLSGHVILNGCTGNGPQECEQKASGAFILPPVYSGQLQTKNTFSFRFGKIEIRAKLPLGDWIFPEIQLKPMHNTYGTKLASGQINLALAKGNRVLLLDNQDIGARYLEENCEFSLRNVHVREKAREILSGFWGDTFHVYSITWTPDSITFGVDGRDIGQVKPPSGGFGRKPEFSSISESPWSKGSIMAPFDQEFYISLGVGVGGFIEFPDGSISNNSHPKPWKNKESKAILNFWMDRDKWIPTWSESDSSLQIDYVKVWAL